MSCGGFRHEPFQIKLALENPQDFKSEDRASHSLYTVLN
jgi:hypothetical protein